MENIGWEIRPAGWILLFVIGIALFCLLNRGFRQPSEKPSDQES
jgi:hypothetical protein